MRTIVIALMLILSLSAYTDSAAAQAKQFPYDALIPDDEVYARSGPDRKYYPTSRFRRGDKVTVLRHDPGGWFMIEPPLGSFAWVRQEFIKREGDRTVIASDHPVVAWVGTSFGDDHFVEQRRLQPGEAVEVLAEKVLKDERGDVLYAKIKSPRGHYRWVPGAKLVTSEKQLAAAAARGKAGDPFANETHSAQPVAGNKIPDELAQTESTAATNSSKKPALSKDASAGKHPAPTPSDLESDDEGQPFASSVASKSGDGATTPFASSKSESITMSVGEERLAEIDETLRDMLQRDTRDWDFARVEKELEALRQQSATADAASRRLVSLQKYKQIKANYDEFSRIMAATERRDAELAAAQRATMPNAVPAVGSSGVAGSRPGAASRTAPSGPAAAPAIQTRPSSAQASSATKGKLSGAGIIQRSNSRRPGVPRHVLVHPNGRVLAYLQGDGVDLDKYLGESMGVEGARSFRSELGADLVIVRAVQPVKLKP